MNEHPNLQVIATNDDSTSGYALMEKLSDAATPGYQVEFDPPEAERAGAFVEDALSEDDAIDSACDVAIP